MGCMCEGLCGMYVCGYMCVGVCVRVCVECMAFALFLALFFCHEGRHESGAGHFLLS